MKALLIGLLLLSGAAQAASPFENYLGSRDRYIQALKRMSDENSAKEDRRALNDLQKQLAGLIGPVDLQGFSRNGKINLETLQPEQLGSGMLDALVYTSGDQRTQVVVTTQDLLKAWIKGHANGSGKENLPQDVESALQSETFYTQAISSDVAVAKYAEIPVSAPGIDGFAYAMLNIRRQDYSPNPPDEIIVTVLRRDKVFIFTQPLAAAIKTIPACDAVWKRYTQETERALKAYSVSQDQKLFDRVEQLEQEGDVQFRQCFGERLKDQAAFAAIERQAQALIQRLPSP